MYICVLMFSLFLSIGMKYEFIILEALFGEAQQEFFEI